MRGRCACGPTGSGLGVPRALRSARPGLTTLWPPRRKLGGSLGGYARRCVGPLEQHLDDLGVIRRWSVAHLVAPTRHGTIFRRRLTCSALLSAIIGARMLLSHMQRRLCFARSRLRHDRIAMRSGMGRAAGPLTTSPMRGRTLAKPMRILTIFYNPTKYIFF